jgi:hypothetical protein
VSRDRRAPDGSVPTQLPWEDDDALLQRFGWRHLRVDGDDTGYYWRDWSPPDIAEAAQLAALTIVRVHGLRVPESAIITLDDISPS